MRLLVVEDNHQLLKGICSVLQDESYETDSAETGCEGWLLADTGIYDCIVLDVMLPDINGLSIIKKLRLKNKMVPILILTAKDGLEDRVRGLDAGGDDYLVKPFAVEELLARIRALLRRNGAVEINQNISCGPISIYTKDYDGYIFGQPLHLTTKEYKVLEYLLINKGKILTREQIFNRVWGFDSDAVSSIVDLYVHYLRKKLTTYRCENYIHTIRAIGYMLKEDKTYVEENQKQIGNS